MDASLPTLAESFSLVSAGVSSLVSVEVSSLTATETVSITSVFCFMKIKRNAEYTPNAKRITAKDKLSLVTNVGFFASMQILFATG